MPPARVPSGAAICVRARAGARPSGRRPTRRRAGPWASWSRMGRRAQEIGLRAAALLDGPGEPGLDGRGQLVDVAAVEAQPGFRAQAVPRAEAAGEDAGLGEEHAGEALGVAAVHADLEPVLAGVAAAADPGRDAADGGADDAHEGECCGLGAERAEDRGGLRALKGQQRAVRVALDVGEGEVPGQVQGVRVLAAGVGDDDEVAAVVGHHEVVEDAARLVEQQRVALAAGGEALDVGRHERLEGGGVAHGDGHLAHVADVEQGGAGAGVGVLGHEAGGVSDGQLVAGERDHLGAELAMQRVERDLVEGVGLVRVDVEHGLGLVVRQARVLPRGATCPMCTGWAAWVVRRRLPVDATPLCPGT